MHRIALLMICAAGTLLGCATRPQPEVFAPDVLSTGNAWKGSFAQDGRSFYFFMKQPTGKENYRIQVSRRQGDAWTAPERVDLGGDFSDLYPTVSPDGRRLVFVSYRPAPGEAPGGEPHAMLWLAPRVGDGWGEAVYLESLNVPGQYHSQPAFDGQGALYFRRSRPGGDTVTYVTRWTGEAYGAPEPYDPINRWSSGWREGLFVWGGVPGPDGSFIVLEVSAVEGKKRGPADLWVTRGRGGTWTEPRPLGNGVNTPGNENFIFFSPDGRDLFFVRDFARFYRVPVAAVLAGD
jgi:hypothetical protein